MASETETASNIIAVDSPISPPSDTKNANENDEVTQNSKDTELTTTNSASSETVAVATPSKNGADSNSSTMSPVSVVVTSPTKTPSKTATETPTVSSNPNTLDRPASELQIQSPSHLSQTPSLSASRENSEDRLPKLQTVVRTETERVEMEAHESNKSATKARDDVAPHHQVLSTIPYRLERLHGKEQMRNVLRMTKLRDLLDASYIFRYIFCLSIGCISFCILMALWKYAFEINQCPEAYEGAHLRLKAMPFKWGFMYVQDRKESISSPLDE